MNEEIKIGLSPGDDFIVAKVFPEDWSDNSKAGKIRKSIDIIKLEFNTAEGFREFYATPDEALQIAQILNTAVSVWLSHGSSWYKKEFEDKKVKLTRSKKHK